MYNAAYEQCPTMRPRAMTDPKDTLNNKNTISKQFSVLINNDTLLKPQRVTTMASKTLFVHCLQCEEGYMGFSSFYM